MSTIAGASVPAQASRNYDTEQPSLDTHSQVSTEKNSDTDIEKLTDSEIIPAKVVTMEPLKSGIQQPPKDPNLIEFDGPDDPANPKNWTTWRKIAITCCFGLLSFVVTFSSSIWSVAIEPVSVEYHISTLTATLGVSLFLLGFVFGPIAFGPASEVFGRKLPLFCGYFCFAIFQIPVAVAQNIETIMICRFLCGLFASAPLAITGGAIADLWNPVERAYALCAFAGGSFAGPVAGPVVGSFVTQDHRLGWRWTAWLTLIMAAFFGLIGLLVIPETSPARIHQLKAKRLRHETKNWALHSKADENPVTVHTIFTIYLRRPFKMLVHEPILALLTAYLSFLYGIIYLLFEAFPYSFGHERGWGPGVSSLPFCSLIVGIFIGAGVMSYSAATNFKRALIKYGRPIPEERLPPMIPASIVLPIAMFWFAWTSFPSITWVPQVLSIALIGASLIVAFWQGMNYIIDCYGFYSNSAIAISTMFRSVMGAVFPLFAVKLYETLGVRWGTSLLAFICAAFIPAPILFYKYGAEIRKRSKFTPTG